MAGIVAAPESRPRVLYLDLLRVAAAVAVVVNHVTMTPMGQYRPIGHPAWWWANVGYCASRWCVPVFLMISGALLLRPESTQMRKVFFRKRLRRILVPTLIWSFLYMEWRAMRTGVPLTWGQAGEMMIEGRPYYHLYFLFLILGLYLITPLLNLFLRSARREDIVYLMLLSFGLAVALTVQESVELSNSSLTMFLPYTGYYVFGYYAAHTDFPPRRMPYAWATLILIITATSTGTYLLMRRYGLGPQGFYLYTYLSPAIIVMSMNVFILGRLWESRRMGRTDSGWLSRRLRQMSAATFGVYLLHPMIMESTVRSLGFTVSSPSPFLTVPVVVVITLAVTYPIIGLARKVPVLRWVVG